MVNVVFIIILVRFKIKLRIIIKYNKNMSNLLLFQHIEFVKN